ncbi:MAG: c-type cytochrome domain-containing protein [Planctomycetota bacterium]|nr:c-type cytochrome domain-containing protein [Planctomycetota bacterium]
MSIVRFDSRLVAAELSPEHSRLVKDVNDAIVAAGKSYASGNYDASGEQIEKAMQRLEVAVSKGGQEALTELGPAIQRIEKAHTLLQFEGISLTPFRIPKLTDSKSDSTKSMEPAPAVPKTQPVTPDPSPKPVPTSGDGEMMISFNDEVAPILVQRCGQCHIRDTKGGFNTATFAALMKGPPEGVVIFAGDTIGSRLIETIETGDMPRGGGRVTPAELKTLKDWINSGAKFDGDDPEAPIGGGAAPAATVNMNLEVRRATGSETVSFAADVAPLLVDNCNGCHLDAMQVRGGLRLDTFAQLLQGGDSGTIIVPGKSADSLLIQKLKGMVGQRMPAGGRPALSDESIKLISTWIDEGATLDGDSPTQPIRVMSQLAWAANASPEEMSEHRAELTAEHLKLVTASSTQVASVETDHFLVSGTVSEGTLELIGKLAESQMKKVRTVVKGGPGEAFFKGRASIFVFPKRYEYSEFAKMVERRSIPSDWTSHWSFDGIDAYLSVVCSEQEEDVKVIESRLASPLVSLAVATRRRGVPRWFAEGAGLASSAQTGAKRDRDEVRHQQVELSTALSTMENAKQFLDGKLSPEHTDLIGGMIVSTMMDRTHRRNFDALIRLLGNGQSFDQAFPASFGVLPEDFVKNWITWVRGS